MAASKAIEKVEEDAVSVFPIEQIQSAVEIMADELGGVDDLEFDRVKVPGAGGIAWEVPDENGEPDSVKEIVGVVVDDHPVSALWLEAFTGGNDQPDAWSVDGITQEVPQETIEKCQAAGMPIPSRDLKACPYNQFGSAHLIGGDGKGKATKNGYRLFVLQPGTVLPIMVALPPTSIRNWTNFKAKRILGRGRRTPEVIVGISLAKAKSSGGIDYSEAKFRVVDQLDPAAAEAMLRFREEIQPMTRRVKVDDGASAPVEGTVAAPAADEAIY